MEKIERITYPFPDKISSIIFRISERDIRKYLDKKVDPINVTWFNLELEPGLDKKINAVLTVTDEASFKYFKYKFKETEKHKDGDLTIVVPAEELVTWLFKDIDTECEFKLKDIEWWNDAFNADIIIEKKFKN